LSCAELKDLILLHAAGACTPEESEQVRQHLSTGCPVCAGAMAEAEAMLASLALALPLESPSESVRQRILDGLDGLKLVERPQRQVALSAPPWWIQLAIPSAIAASVAAAITLLFAMRLIQRVTPTSPDASLMRTVATLAEMTAQQQDEINQLRKGTQSVSWGGEPELRVFNLQGTSNQPAGASGRIFWDPKEGMWHFFASGMKVAPPGKTYELWFVSSDGKTKLPAGSFNPQPSGEAELESPVPPSIAPRLTIAAVTDEPANADIQSPSGSFQMEGALP
jgi:Anti-sigma-K factor rskA